MNTENAPGPHGGNRGSRQTNKVAIYDTTNRTWVRVSRSAPCPVCRRDSWCSIGASGHAVICMRTRSTRATRNHGYLHLLADPIQLPTITKPRARLDHDFEHLHRLDLHRAVAMPVKVDEFAKELGVDSGALVATRIGWSGECWSWPMHAADGRIVGLRLRDPQSGRKFSVRGSHNGLFIPPSVGPQHETLFIVEGPTDLAALMTLGEFGIGRPSCRGGERECEHIARGRKVVIVSDADEPGRRGTAALAVRLLLVSPDVRIVEPPVGFKDLRQWVQAGAARGQLHDLVVKAQPLGIALEGGRHG